MSKIIEEQIQTILSIGDEMIPSDLDVLVQIAKAEAWAECVAWFASQPQHRHEAHDRVRGTVLLDAEQGNPYVGQAYERTGLLGNKGGTDEASEPDNEDKITRPRSHHHDH